MWDRRSVFVACCGAGNLACGLAFSESSRLKAACFFEPVFGLTVAAPKVGRAATVRERWVGYFASTTPGAPGCGEVAAVGRARPTTARAAR
jgi:hypothetical protein